jgi:hypothetical protein
MKTSIFGDNRYSFSNNTTGHHPYNSTLKDRTHRRGGAHFLTEGNNTLSSPGGSPRVLFTVNHVDRKTLGFVDFDLQLRRPAIQPTNAHDQRFEPYNMFPAASTKTRLP